jgi:hypothetical protein
MRQWCLMGTLHLVGVLKTASKTTNFLTQETWYPPICTRTSLWYIVILGEGKIKSRVPGKQPEELLCILNLASFKIRTKIWRFRNGDGKPVKKKCFWKSKVVCFQVFERSQEWIITKKIKETSFSSWSYFISQDYSPNMPVHLPRVLSNHTYLLKYI